MPAMASTAVNSPLTNIEAKGGLRAWIVVFAAGLFFFYEFMQLNMFNAINPGLLRTFDVDAAQLGHLSAFYFYSNLVFLFPAGMLLDRFSTRRIILIAASICVLGTFSFGLAPNFTVAKIARFMTGIGSAFCFLSSVRIASRWFPARQMALATGFIVTMAMFGGWVAQTPLTLLVEHYGWRHAIIMDGFFGVAIVAFAILFIRDYPADMAHAQEHHQQQLQLMGFWNSIRQALLNVQNWLCGFYTSLLNLPIFLFGALWGGLYLTQVHHFTRTEAANITSMVFIGTIIGSPLAGWISDQLGNRRQPMIIGALLSLAMLFGIMYLPSAGYHTMLLLFFLTGLFTSTQVISYPLVAETNPRALTASSVSVVSFCCIGSGAIFQPLFGWLMDLRWTGQYVDHVRFYPADAYHLALMIMPIAFVIGLCAILLAKESHCHIKEEL